MKVDESFGDYLGNEAISSSDLKQYILCPAKFRKVESKESRSLEFGSALHDYVLCEGADTVLAPHLDLRRKADKEEYNRLKLEYSNVVRGDDVKHIKGMKESIQEHSPEFFEYIQSSDPECSFYATCPESGLKLKARPDIYNKEKRAKLDLKTTVDAVKFINQVYRYKYYIQDAFHSYVCELSGYPVDISGWFAVEKEAPYVHRLVLIDKGTQMEMRQYVIDSLVKLAGSMRGEEGFPSLSPRLARQDFVYIGEDY